MFAFSSDFFSDIFRLQLIFITELVCTWILKCFTTYIQHRFVNQSELSFLRFLFQLLIILKTQKALNQTQLLYFWGRYDFIHFIWGSSLLTVSERKMSSVLIGFTWNSITKSNCRKALKKRSYLFVNNN